MKSPWIVQLAMFAMVVFGGLGTAFADIAYSFTTIDAPGATNTNDGTVAYGINDSGQIVGRYSDSSGNHSFLDSGGSFTTNDFPGSPTYANGINDSGQIVGYVGGFGISGFLDTGGSFTTIAFPGALATYALGINDGGQIVGNYPNPNLPTQFHSFVYTGGSFTTFDVPGAYATFATGINNGGQIVGGFSNASLQQHGFLDTGGSFTTFDVPGALDTNAFGINDSGQIVGSFRDATGTHGFLATPTVVPEPGSLPLIAACMIGLGTMARYRKRA